MDGQKIGRRAQMIINILDLIDLVLDAIRAGHEPELLINGEYYTISTNKEGGATWKTIH